MKSYILSLLLVSSLASFSQADKINWLSFEEAIALNKKEPRKVLVDVYTSWCGWCKRMDATTFKNPEIVSYINKKYWAVKLNAERKDTVTLGSQQFVNENPEGRRSPHQLAVALLNGKMTYPSIVYLDEEIEMLQPIAGYQSAENIAPILKFFGENEYKETTWPEYQKKFKKLNGDK